MTIKTEMLHAPVEHSARTGKPPVFVVGCARSGTTLLYHMLLSAGEFAVFRAESHAFNVLAPRFGNLATRSDRQRLLSEWLSTKHFRLSGLNAHDFSELVVQKCRNTGDFLRLFMSLMAARQQAGRWADCTPTHVLHMLHIKEEIPDALFIHIIRDGRDVALSYAKQGWVRPLPGDAASALLVAGLDWQWQVRKGTAAGKRLGADYIEVRFEDLIRAPQPTLDKIGRFIDHSLDYAKIRSVAIGSVSEPNTSFGAEAADQFSPIGRWKTKLRPQQAAALEFLLRETLVELGYPVLMQVPGAWQAARLRARRRMYHLRFSAKHFARVHTPLGRLTSVETLHNW